MVRYYHRRRAAHSILILCTCPLTLVAFQDGLFLQRRRNWEHPSIRSIKHAVNHNVKKRVLFHELFGSLNEIDLLDKQVSTDQSSNVDSDRAVESSPSEQATRSLAVVKKKIRLQIFSFLNSSRVEVTSALIVLLTAFLVALDTLENLPSLPMPDGSLLDSHIAIDNSLAVINILFAIDFFVRWYAAGNFNPRYLKTPLVLLDVLVILVPLWFGVVMPAINEMMTVTLSIPNVPRIGELVPTDPFFQFDFTGLQNLLLLRILRLQRVLTDTKTFERFEIALGVKSRDVRPYQLQLARVGLSIFTLLSVASGLIYTAEHKVNPQIPDFFAALYFGLTTLTTVGFGDITPVTAEGRLIVGLSIFAGVTIIPAQAASLVDAILQFSNERKPLPRPRTRGKTTNIKMLNENPPQAEPTTVPQNGIDSTAVKDYPQGERKKNLVNWLGICCLGCGEPNHRENASYCWNCGSKL